MDELINLLIIDQLEAAENVILFNNPQRNPQNPFELSDRQFIKLFRLSKDLTRDLINILTPFIRKEAGRTDIDISTKVLIALHFYAYGTYQTGVGVNKYLDVCQSTVSNCLKEVTTALNHPTVFNEWVCFPNNFEKLNQIRRKFFEEHNFPGLVGCIDCTHVAIRSPKIKDPEYPEHLYVNRKNYHSINVQLICDSNLKIINVDARYPGSTNDTYIWNRSTVQTLMRNLHERENKDYFLLGDSGYPLRSWLLTPLEHEPNPGTPEARYNQRHRNTRVKIECCNGVLKSRFRCLLKHRVLHYNPEFSCEIINACVVLHNMCIEHRIPEVGREEGDNQLVFGIFQNFDHVLPEEVGDDVVLRRINPELLDGKRAQLNIIRNLQ